MSSSIEPSPFSIGDDLPSGTTLLEASAGTGKTWAIAALVTRYVAEGVAALDDLLVVTFGRAASAELRDRVRERLVEAEACLAGPRPTGAVDDALLAVLWDADDTQVRRRRDRLRHAVSRFDEATITTTHGFCHAVLRSLGTMGDVEPGTTLVEDEGDVLEQVVDDLYLRAAGGGSVPPFTPAQAADVARAAVRDPAATLEPRDAEPGSVPDLRRRFAEAVRAESARRRLAARSMSYDDLLDRLAAALEPDDAPARQVMRDRWRIVLVDEFQDTDPVQWAILERAFVGHARVVLVGDPKQAIYAFRGGDVHTYLAAAAVADTRRTLLTNHRSDAALVERIDRVLRGTALGDEQILVRPVTAAHQGSRISGPGEQNPLRIRVLTRVDAGAPEDKHVPADRARTLIAADVAADVVELLDGRATLTPAGEPARAVRAGDVAVLVERHHEARIIHDALTAAGVAAVHAGGTDVLLSDGSQAWVTLLAAMESPHRSGLVRSAAMTPFFGRRAAELADDGDTVTDDVAGRLRDLSDILRQHGAAGLVEALLSDAGVVHRVLSVEGGRRLLTDLEHVGHLLQDVARQRRLGLSGLLRWLTDRRADGAQAAERGRRLDSDAEAVQIVTTYVSKGLQYPVVYAPFLFNRHVRPPELPRFHDASGTRCLDVGGSASPERVRAAEAEDAGESLRLLYVAMTRAQSRLIMHWSPTWDCETGALSRILLRDTSSPQDSGSPLVPDRVPRPSDSAAIARLRSWEGDAGPCIERVLPRDVASRVPAPAQAELVLRTLDRPVDTGWTRTSYSSLVRVETESLAVASEPAEAGTVDEVDVAGVSTSDHAAAERPTPPTPEHPTPEPPRLEPSPWAELVGGAALGTVVHAVLENVDAAAGDLQAHVSDLVRTEVASAALPVDIDVLSAGVHAALTTPLGPLVDDATLQHLLTLGPLRELDFEMPLAGGDLVRDPGFVPDLGHVADLIEATLADSDPMRPFGSLLREAPFGSRLLRGYLTGSIDLLLRRPDGRTLVVDHKTNRLEGPDDGLNAYAPSRLSDAMLHTTYPLQAMLYAAAQHRFLRWRMPDYDPERHLGGILYLFVRGMTGPAVPREDGHPYGVFAWRPPAALAVGLSDLLDGRRP